MPLINIVETSPGSADALQLIGELDVHLLAHPYPAQSRHAFSVERLLREQVVFFVSYYDGQPAGCGGLKIFSDYAEVKRMFVRPNFRGKGLGKAMLRRLVAHAHSQGVNILRLETGIYEMEAICLYEKFGFSRRSPFGEYRDDPMSVYLEMSPIHAD